MNELEKAKAFLGEEVITTTIVDGNLSINIDGLDIIISPTQVTEFAERYDEMNPVFEIKSPEGIRIHPSGGGWQTLEDAEAHFYNWLESLKKVNPSGQYSLGVKGFMNFDDVRWNCAFLYPQMFCLMHKMSGHDELGCRTEVTVGEAQVNIPFPVAYLSVEDAQREIADLLGTMYNQVYRGERNWEDRYTEDDYYVARMYPSDEEWGVFDIYDLAGNPIIRYNCLTDFYTQI